METRLVVLVLVVCLLLTVRTAGAQNPPAPEDDQWAPITSKSLNTPFARTDDPYSQTILLVGDMVRDPNARRLVESRALSLINLTWEDTGRFKNSAVGPNISDMTIQVAHEDPLTRKLSVKSMPVIRYPNFQDRTADIDPENFALLVGNEKGEPLKRLSLYEFLKNPAAHLSNPESWRGANKTLLAERDSKVLASAQAAFLPVPREGKATFNPVIFNYQSMSGDPAVLTILATREGTSTTIIDNKRDAFREGAAWGQRLFHNQNGERASLTGQRLGDYKASSGPDSAAAGGETTLNMVLLIQVPLKQKNPMKNGPVPLPMASGVKEFSLAAKSDVEAAVIGHGDLEGPFTEIDNLAIERDPDFPVRVTVQFYKATSNGVVNDSDIDTIKADIDGIYARGENVGSLVVSGETGRPTEYAGLKVQPADWWENFWNRYEQNMGESREEAIRKLKELLGLNYENVKVSDLYVRDLLRK